jgi:hypothetical protein
MKNKIVLLALLLLSLDLVAQVFGSDQIENNAFQFNAASGELSMRRYGAGDLVFKRALVPQASELCINYGGDFSEGVKIMGSKLAVQGSLFVAGLLGINGADFKLGLNNGRDKGIKTNQRALVHYTLDRLFVNYGGDFEGGVVISGPKTIIEGNVGIGTTDTQGFNLAVKGNIVAERVKVALQPNWADFVFTKDYPLPTLQEVEKHIKEKGHLKDVPSAAEVKKEGFFLGEMDAKLLQKIEELTLYVIAQEKQLIQEKLRNDELEKRLTALEKK